jgi:uncharacterized protein
MRMDLIDSTPELPRASRLDRLQALLEVVLLSGLFSSFLAALPFALSGAKNSNLTRDAATLAGYLVLEATISLVIIVVVLRSHGESVADLGLRPRNLLSHAAVGILVVPMLFLVNGVVALMFRRYFPSLLMDRNPLLDSIRSGGDLFLLNAAALYAGGLKEELQRAFILNRFSRHLGGAGIGLVLWSVAFGVGHYLQGIPGVVAATVFGFFFGLLYLARRNLAAPIVAHAVYDTLALWAYWFVRPATP